MHIIYPNVQFNLGTPHAQYEVLVNPTMRAGLNHTLEDIIVNASTPEPLSTGWLVKVYGKVVAYPLFGDLFVDDGNFGYRRNDVVDIPELKVKKDSDRNIAVSKLAKSGKKTYADQTTTSHLQNEFWRCFLEQFFDIAWTRVLHAMLLRVEHQRRQLAINQLLDSIHELDIAKVKP